MGDNSDQRDAATSEQQADPETVRLLLAAAAARDLRKNGVFNVLWRYRAQIAAVRKKKVSHARIAEILNSRLGGQGLKISRMAVRKFCIKELRERVQKRNRKATAGPAARPAPSRKLETSAPTGKMNPAFRQNRDNL